MIVIVVSTAAQEYFWLRTGHIKMVHLDLLAAPLTIILRLHLRTLRSGRRGLCFGTCQPFEMHPLQSYRLRQASKTGTIEIISDHPAPITGPAKTIQETRHANLRRILTT